MTQPTARSIAKAIVWIGSPSLGFLAMRSWQWANVSMQVANRCLPTSETNVVKSCEIDELCKVEAEDSRLVMTNALAEFAGNPIYNYITMPPSPMMIQTIVDWNDPSTSEMFKTLKMRTYPDVHQLAANCQRNGGGHVISPGLHLHSKQYK